MIPDSVTHLIQTAARLVTMILAARGVSDYKAQLWVTAGSEVAVALAVCAADVWVGRKHADKIATRAVENSKGPT